MAARATTRGRTAARGKEAERRLVYQLSHKCQGCGRLIVPGQTWKWTPEGGKVHYYCARNPYGEPTGRRYAPARYTLVRHTKELIGYGEKGQPIYKLEPESTDNKTRAISMAKQIVADGGVAEVWDETQRVRLYPAGEGNPVSFDPRHWLRYGTVAVPPRRATSRHRAAAPAPSGETVYRGVRIWRDAGGWRVSKDPESLFDSLKDAKQFVAAAGRRHLNPAMPWWKRGENPVEGFDFEGTARQFGHSIASGRGPRPQVVGGWVKKARRELDEHRRWLRAKGYEDDGVAQRMERKIQWWEIALAEYRGLRRTA